MVSGLPTVHAVPEWRSKTHTQTHPFQLVHTKAVAYILRLQRNLSSQEEPEGVNST